MLCFLLINSVLLNLFCVWILFYNASSHSCFTFLFARLLIFLFRRGGVKGGWGGVTTASLNCKGTDPDNSDSFTVMQLCRSKVLSHLRTFSTRWSGWDRDHSFCEPTLPTLSSRHCEEVQSFFQRKNINGQEVHTQECHWEKQNFCCFRVTR